MDRFCNIFETPVVLIANGIGGGSQDEQKNDSHDNYTLLNAHYAGYNGMQCTRLTDG